MSETAPKTSEARSSTRTLVAVIVFLGLVVGLAIVVGGSGDDGGGMAGMDAGKNGTMTEHDMANMTHETDDTTSNATTETNGSTGGMGNMSRGRAGLAT
jgi:hypothetical protein